MRENLPDHTGGKGLKQEFKIRLGYPTQNTANTKYTVAEPSVVACFVLLIIKGCEEYCSSLILETFEQ